MKDFVVKNILNLRKKNSIPNFVKSKIFKKLLNRFTSFSKTPNEVKKYAKILIVTDNNCIQHYNIEILYFFYPKLKQKTINTK